MRQTCFAINALLNSLIALLRQNTQSLQLTQCNLLPLKNEPYQKLTNKRIKLITQSLHNFKNIQKIGRACKTTLMITPFKTALISFLIF